ncbi:LacI family DNA-binding transcriptional regulator [Nocardioides sp.]|uniref:LacI family DNA-binding transcriptional regulator n=1 Tax=Nocardioides sp. TaxID=35761 RepID=UPI0039E4473E
MPRRTRRRSVSMADIAQVAGVSVSTVSHVVNQTRPVAPATADAVLSAMAELGYVPDRVTRSMRTEGQLMIGLAMSSISNVYFGDVVHGLERAAEAAGYSVLLAETHDDPHGELRAVTHLLARSVDAIVLAHCGDPDRALRYCAQRDVPVILVDRLDNRELDQIGPENVESTALLAEHLAGLGHTRVGMVAGRPGLSTTLDRVAGFRAGLARSGIEVDEDLVVSGDSTTDGAHAATMALLQGRRPPTALVVSNNLMTIGVMRAARDLGMSVPGDLALVAFDDFAWADLFHPRLTVMAQPAVEMGAEAFGLALNRLKARESPARRVVLHPTFMHRDSCGCGQPA